MGTTEAFYNEILPYYSIFPHGFSLRGKGKMKKSYHKINKTKVHKYKLICTGCKGLTSGPEQAL